MVNLYNQPHGFGRAIDSNKKWFYDAQWKDGMVHGYYRYIIYNGFCAEFECKNDMLVRRL